ncbi:MAG: hypothetical protein ACJ8F1_14180 [Polyangia bacterium]
MKAQEVGQPFRHHPPPDAVDRVWPRNHPFADRRLKRAPHELTQVVQALSAERLTLLARHALLRLEVMLDLRRRHVLRPLRRERRFEDVGRDRALGLRVRRPADPDGLEPPADDVADGPVARPVSRLIFRHMGWREHGGRWVYLFQGGGVGADDITLELDPPLDRFILPPSTVDLREAVGWSLRILDAAPPSVAIPLLAATYAAPLSFIVNPDFALWLVGPTGSLKSELAALSQRHFGTFDRKTLPGSWTSTENALEARLFTVKDAIAVIDDYAPNADSRAQQELEKRAQRIIRGIGNRASRGRLRADLSQQPDRPPRGMVICTGEDLPSGHSIQARLVIVEVDRERLNVSVVSICRRTATGLHMPCAVTSSGCSR